MAYRYNTAERTPPSQPDKDDILDSELMRAVEARDAAMREAARNGENPRKAALSWERAIRKISGKQDNSPE